MKLGKPIHDGTRAGISRRKAAKTRCCPRLVTEPPQQCQMHLDSISCWCLWWMRLSLPSCLSSPLGRDGCPPSKGSRMKDTSSLHLLLSGRRNSLEFAETSTSTGCNALFNLLPKPWIPRHHLAGDGNPPHVPRLLEGISRVKVLRHPR